ncbi:hypothetical protein HNR46_002762 [Haloferula luteola]|uniref:Exo-alpha-sialidase n=1 Tax=Haloferula luteola TaxID=595692 RepID=A0A840V663_9BACT|nr:sialidase family protein [Haloferula luteola]MBB5352516.1 hypothetical protein [Haloferula luteola]
MRAWLLAAIGLGVVSAAEIDWQEESRTLVAEGGGYGRIARIDGERWMCAYSRRGAIQVRFTEDGGLHWGVEQEVGREEGAGLTNAEVLVRKNGEIWCFFNRRPREGSSDPFAVGFFRSADGGRKWGKPEVIYEAGKEFENGCWEPAALELASGEVQVYFANEGPYRDSNEQEISLLRTQNGGRSWSEAETVAFRSGHRDGMPVPVALPEVNGIAVAIEDNGLRGTFKPVILGTSAERGGWKDGVVDSASFHRWRALKEPLAARAYAGAPYLRWVRKGVTVLSFQLAENGEMRDSRMAVCLGNGKAQDFETPSFPFPEGRGQLWNALFVVDAHTVMAITEASLDGKRGIWTIEGTVRP